MNKTKYLIILVLIVTAGAAGFFWTKNKITQNPAEVKGEATSEQAPTAQPEPNFPKTLGDFLITDKEVCKKDNKPIVYFFGSSSCPHCVWQKPVMKKVIDKFGKEVDYHENIDTQTDSDILAKYSNINPGYVPFLVLGCKYARVGSGETTGEEKEIEALTAIICKLTGNKPSSVCNALKDKISEIK